jgi:hypothetical protein
LEALAQHDHEGQLLTHDCVARRVLRQEPDSLVAALMEALVRGGHVAYRLVDVLVESLLRRARICHVLLIVALTTMTNPHPVADD